MRHPTMTVLLLACLALAAQAQNAAESRSPLALSQRAEARARYAQPSWTRGAMRVGLANELALDGFVAAELGSERGLVTRTFRHADTPAAAPSFVVESFVADSIDGAQDALVTWLAGVQSAQTMPGLAELGLSVGEAGFAGRSGAGPNTLAWLAFVRGNVAVRVVACDAPREPGLDLGALATAVDLAVQRTPALAAGAAPAKPQIERLSLPRLATVAGTNLRLDWNVIDPAHGEPHLEWTVGGPGQGYVERAKDGAWELHTTGPGVITLGLEVTGSTGTFARREVTLNVLDD